MGEGRLVLINVCPSCDGNGWVSQTEHCTDCFGRGVIEVGTVSLVDALRSLPPDALRAVILAALPEVAAMITAKTPRK